jgi:prepilin-type N-terminal cleavage/methylation domain-containing protein
MNFSLKHKDGFTPTPERALGKNERKAFDACLVSGFTMIELLVAMSVFIIIISITSGIFLSSMRSNRTAIALISANSDGQLTLEQIARVIRKGLGTSFVAQTAVGNGTAALPQFDCLHFRYGNEYRVYRWNRSDRSLELNIGSNRYASCDDSTGIFSGIISENLTVDFANFRVDNSQSRYYPKITVLLRVGTKKTQISQANIPFTNLQVSISPRNDIRY